MLVKTEFISVKDFTQGGIMIPARIEHFKIGNVIKQYLIYI